jgi:hypothetical protein
MPTSHPLHPIAEERLRHLTDELEAEFGRTDSPRKILNAVIHGATAAQTLGMLEAFARARREYNDAHGDEPEGASGRAIGGR